MLRYFVYLIEIVFCFIMQSSVFSYFRVSGVVPDLILILVIQIAYSKGRNTGMFAGFFSGLLLDVMFSQTIGVCALLYLLIGFLAGFTHRIYRNRDFIVPASLVLSGEFLYSVMYYITSFFLLGKLEIGEYLINTIIPRTIYTFIAAVFLYPLFYLIHGLLCRAEGVKNE